MEFDLVFYGEMFARTFDLWWVMIPAIFLGLIVGAIPGFSAANTIIILLPLTLAMDPEVGLVFMVAPTRHPILRPPASAKRSAPPDRFPAVPHQ